MSKDSVRFVAKLRAETCSRAGIHAYLRARAMSREILWQEPWNSHKQLYTYQFSEKMVGTKYQGYRKS